MSKKLTKMMWYDGLSSVKYLQNFWCFFYSKAEEKKKIVLTMNLLITIFLVISWLCLTIK